MNGTSCDPGLLVDVEGAGSPARGDDRFRTDDPERLARSEELVKQWSDFAYSFSRYYYGRFPGAGRSDVNQAALLGMVEASRIHDDSRGNFSTIASWYMRKHILRLNATAGSMVRHSKNPKYRPSTINKVLDRMRSEGVERPEFDAACDRLDIPEAARDTVKLAWELNNKEYESIGTRENEPAARGENPTVDEAIQSEERHRFRSALARLPEIVREVLLDKMRGERQADTGARLGICRPSVARYQRVGMEWLKFYMGLTPEPLTRLVILREVHHAETGTAVPNPGGNDHAKAR